MATLVTRKFGSYMEVNAFLRGDITSGPVGGEAPVTSPTVLYGLHNKTLVFTTPGTTVTFSDATGAGLSIKQIADQIQTALTATHVVTVVGRRIRIEKATAGTIVLAGSGTATTQLGFGSGVTVTTTKYAAPDGAAPRFVWMAPVGIGESVIVMTEE